MREPNDILDEIAAAIHSARKATGHAFPLILLPVARQREFLEGWSKGYAGVAFTTASHLILNGGASRCFGCEIALYPGDHLSWAHSLALPPLSPANEGEGH